MAGIPWAKYDRTDWKRLPGGSRRYYNVLNPNVTISRRQYDQQYGSAKFHGTYEKKARTNAGNATQLLRPARGRSSALKLPTAEKQVEIGRRRVVQAETKALKLTEKLRAQKHRTPQTISMRSFKRGRQIRKIATGVNREEIENIRAAAAKSGLVFGYWVGLTIVSDRDGMIKTPTCFSQRDINWAFSEEDFQKCLDMAQNKMSYSQLVGMWIALHLKRAAAIKNGARKP